MNNKVKTVLYIVIFVVLIVGSTMGYNYLSKKYNVENPINSQDNTTENPADYLDNKDENTPVDSPETPSEDRDEDDDDRLKALDFTVYDYDGNKVTLYDYIGTPIVLNFWASWCSPCRAEMPHFNKVSEEYTEDELIFLMIDLVDGQRETFETGKKYIEEKEYTFTVLFDTDQDASYTYGIRSIPSTLFIGSEGYVEAGVEGGIDESTLRRGISLILNK